jgi:hypothetical protein
MGLSHVFSFSPIKSSGSFSFSCNKTAFMWDIGGLSRICWERAARQRRQSMHCAQEAWTVTVLVDLGCLAGWQNMGISRGDVSLVTPRCARL